MFDYDNLVAPGPLAVAGDLELFALTSAWDAVHKCPRRCDMCFESTPVFLEGGGRN